MNQSSKLSITFIGCAVLYFAVSLLMSFVPAEIEIPVYLNLLISQMLIIIPAVLYMKKSRKSLKKLLAGKRLSGWAVVCLVVFIFAAEPLMMFLNYVSSLLFGNAVAGLSEELLSLPTITNVLFIAVMPAVVEETVFRGIFYQGYRRHGFWKAALISGLFFGLMHMNWNQFSYGFVLGILFAFLIEATGNIRAAMIVHFGINFESVMAVDTLRRSLGEQELTELLAQAGQAGVLESIEGMNLFYGTYLFLAAAISAAVCIFLIWLTAKLSQRCGYMSWMLWGGERRHLQTLEKQPLFDRWMAAAIAIPVIIMTLILIL